MNQHNWINFEEAGIFISLSYISCFDLKVSQRLLQSHFILVSPLVLKTGCPRWPLFRGFSQTSRLLRWNQSSRVGMFLFLCEVEGGKEVKFVQAWWVQRGGLSHTRRRMKGQRWHSLAQEWKTFSAENREATTGRGSAGRPWLSMYLLKELTCLEMQRRRPLLARPCLFGSGDNVCW